MRYLIYGLAASVLSLGMSSAHAGITASVERSAAELAEIRGFLEGDDENKAVAAMAIFLESENPVFREMAIDYGLNHTQSYIRAAVFEQVLRASRTLQFEYQHSESFTQAQDDMYKETGGGRAFSTRIRSGNYEGYFRSLGSNTSSTSITVNGTAMHLHHGGCEGRFSLEGVEMAGNLICGEVSIPARIRLY